MADFEGWLEKSGPVSWKRTWCKDRGRFVAAPAKLQQALNELVRYLPQRDVSVVLALYRSAQYVFEGRRTLTQVEGVDLGSIFEEEQPYIEYRFLGCWGELLRATKINALVFETMQRKRYLHERHEKLTESEEVELNNFWDSEGTVGETDAERAIDAFLCGAVEHNQLDVVTLLLNHNLCSSDPQVSFVRTRGLIHQDSTLHIAAQASQVPMLRILLQRTEERRNADIERAKIQKCNVGASTINRRDDSGHTPLQSLLTSLRSSSDR